MVPLHTLVSVRNPNAKGPGAEPPLPAPPCRGGRSGKKRPAAAPEPRIDLDRLVWDPEYRDEIRRSLNRHA